MNAFDRHPPLPLCARDQGADDRVRDWAAYLYSDVPDEDVQAFRAAFSKGVHFNRHIRDRFRCRELTPAIS
ncbi:KTSC domain-containing protein [Sphingomonas daechungensis]|uniref:KTSC domain-containing protein n=1 Tax=Sphingomonas daechungensis TaxID=1176646 RepID=UPI0037842F5F